MENSTFHAKFPQNNTSNPNFLILVLLVELMFDCITQISLLTCLEVPVVGGGWLESEFSDRLWLKPSLGQVEQKVLKEANFPLIFLLIIQN